MYEIIYAPNMKYEFSNKGYNVDIDLESGHKLPTETPLALNWMILLVLF